MVHFLHFLLFHHRQTREISVDDVIGSTQAPWKEEGVLNVSRYHLLVLSPNVTRRFSCIGRDIPRGGYARQHILACLGAPFDAF